MTYILCRYFYLQMQYTSPHPGTGSIRQFHCATTVSSCNRKNATGRVFFLFSWKQQVQSKNSLRFLLTSVANIGKKTTLPLLLCFGSWHCTYRFSNLYLQPPKGIHTLYIESIFDSSREVVPHEILWEKIQKAFALNGKLVLTPKVEADAYLRAHITNPVVK